MNLATISGWQMNYSKGFSVKSMYHSWLHILKIVYVGSSLGLLVVGPLRAELVDPDPPPPAAPDAMTQIINDAVIAGTPEQRFVFDTYTIVTGGGHFDHTHSMGIFAPGHSPGVVSGFNTAYSGKIQIELGGTDPGFGSGKHDQINDAGTISLFGTPTLEILPFEDFVPAPGDTFEILTWQTGLDGSFATTTIDSHFTLHGITFQQIITNPTGAGNLTLVAIPEPSAFLFLGVVSLLMTFSVRSSTARRQHRLSK